MQTILDHLLKLILAAALCGGWVQHASATILTVTGTLFDVQYDDAQLNPSSGQFSLFGAPTINGSNIIFRPNNLFAQSSSAGLVGVPATFNLTIVPRTGLQLQVRALSLTEVGDFSLRGNGSYVNVGGQLIAYDPSNFFSYTTSNLAMVAPDNAANTVSALPNVQNVNWIAQAAINSSANPSPFANPAGVNVVLENQLQAFAPTSDATSFAFIQKKVAGDTVTLTVVSQVPIPAAGLLFASGFLGLIGMARRRGRANSRVIA
jgi:hypothetical protein